MSPFFSVIVPAYNMEKYIFETLQSVYLQSFSNYEVIVVDDGSTDSTFEICNKFIEKDKRFRIYTQENQGPMMARKYGLFKAKGEYCLFLDSDDCYVPDLMKTVHELIVTSECDIVVFNALSFYVNAVELHGKVTLKNEVWDRKTAIVQVLKNDKMYSLCAKAIKREVIIQSGDKFYQQINHLEDFIQTLYYVLQANKIVTLNHYLYRCRRRKESLSSVVMSTDIIKDIIDIKEWAEKFVKEQIPMTEKDVIECRANVLNEFMGYIYSLNQNKISGKEKKKNLEKIMKEIISTTYFERKYISRISYKNRIRAVLLEKKKYGLLIALDFILFHIQKYIKKIKNYEYYEK